MSAQRPAPPCEHHRAPPLGFGGFHPCFIALVGLAQRYWPELLLVSWGIFMRATMAFTYDVRWGYDFPDHWAVIDWFLTHRELPSLMLSKEADHGPLFYVLSALLHRAGLPMLHMNVFSIACGSLRLLVIWCGLERNLGWNRPARLATLAIAAVLPVSIHNDGMVTNEALCNLLSALAIVLMLEILRSDSLRRWPLALALGLALGLDMLTKISTLALIAAGGAAAFAELCWVHRDGWRGRGRRMLSWLGALTIVIATSGWLLVHHQRTNGKMLVSGFDGSAASWYAPIADTPYLKRRAGNYFYGWTSDLYASPYCPTGIMPVSYFWPPLVASTFVDYYSFGFAGRTPPAEIQNTRPVPIRAALLSSYAVAGGTWIALTTMVAWLAVAFSAWRNKHAGLVLVLLVPLLGLLGQLHFAVKFAIDAQGPVKGAYMQFAAVPLYGLFGLAATWGWKRTWPYKLAIVVHTSAFAAVAVYCLYARLG